MAPAAFDGLAASHVWKSLSEETVTTEGIEWSGSRRGNPHEEE